MSKQVLILLLMGMLLASTWASSVSAEDGDPMTMEDAGLLLIAMRNDTLDTDEDGVTDAIRVVLVLNATAGIAEVNMQFTATTGPRTIDLWDNRSISGQENLSLTIDAWEDGQYGMTLRMFDPVTSSLLAEMDVGSYWLEPALALPYISLSLSAPNYIETGDSCIVSRTFTDEVGYRYGMMGSRTFTGAPFKIYDSDISLDCSQWPAGDYQLRENYQNGLGQATEASQTLTIHNRPAPAFNLSTVGGGGELGTLCQVSISAEMIGGDFANWQKTWDVFPSKSVGNDMQLDCTNWDPGVHKVMVTITNSEGSSTTRGVNVVRLPPMQPSQSQEEASITWPTRSAGDSLEREPIGWYTIGLVSLIAFLFSLVLTVGGASRPKSEAEIDFSQATETALPHLAGPLVETPDSHGLPTYTDLEGITWRRHDDGQVDWWDITTDAWVPFQ